jgi:RNA polymerase sigma-70 factor (ECF subfamily)
MADWVIADIERVLAGEPTALKAFVRELTPVIQARVAKALFVQRHRAVGRDVRQEVEDLTQELFVVLFADRGAVLRHWDPEKGLSLKNFVGLVTERQVRAILCTGKRCPWTEDPTLDVELVAEADRRAEASVRIRVDEPEQRFASAEVLHVVLERLEQQLSPLGMRLFQLLVLEEHEVEKVCAQMSMKRDAVYAWRSRLARLAREIYAEVTRNVRNQPRVANTLTGGT